MSPEEHLYQYDGTSNLASMNGKYIDKYANVFQAQGREAIKEISFYTMNPDVTYTAEIYINQSLDSSDPTGGKTPVFTASGRIKEQGYHTVKLNTPVNVENGDYFSVVLQTKCASSDISIPIDSTVDYGWYSSKANAEKGQSFCMSYGRWYDLNYSSDPKYVWNLRIKALTEDQKAENTPASVPEEVPSNPETSPVTEAPNSPYTKTNDNTVSAGIQKKASGKIVFKKKIRSLKVKQKATVKAVITPAKAAHTTLVYTSSNPKYAKVNKKGQITAKKAGKGKKVRITASAKDGSAKKASIVIKIK